jgi:hypothetical protein
LRCRHLATIYFLSLLPVFTADAAFFPGTDYDPAIPRFKDVLGFAAGDKVTIIRAVFLAPSR